MSADVHIDRAIHPDCHAAHHRHPDDELNVTYNLSSMLREAGFVGWGGIVGKPAQKVGRHILAVLDRMERNPGKWRAMNPENGWGTYDKCLQRRMRYWATRCRDAGPNDTIGGWL